MIRERVSYFHGPSKVMGTKKGGISHGNTVRTRERERENKGGARERECEKKRIKEEQGKETIKRDEGERTNILTICIDR